MKYAKDKQGNNISVLGFGCMRWQRKHGTVDLDKAEQQLITGYLRGINYFDTAYTYPGIEEALGTILQRTGLRDKIYIATKLPHYLIKKETQFEGFFREELSRLKTDHIDYYLMHMLQDVRAWDRLKNLGIEDWLEAKKESGAIRQVGFSYHGNSDDFIKLIDAYEWDFCQIQYNYMDEHSQAGKAGLDYAASKGIPVIIMEPLRGGRLGDKLSKEAKAVFGKNPGKLSPAQWGLTWLWNQPEVTCVLSGMNSIEMINQNCDAADRSERNALTQSDMAMFREVRDIINRNLKVGCTGCRYCMPCPHNVDIPGTFSAYNNINAEGRGSAVREYIMCTALRPNPTSASNCKNCGICAKKCPQHIDVPAEIKKAALQLENPIYKAAKFLLPHFRKY